jgi:hypothetical protein
MLSSSFLFLIVTTPKKEKVLKWKFHYYDRNGDDGLTSGEQWLFLQEVLSFIHCSSFFNHVNDLIDANDDGVLQSNEWGDYFDGELLLWFFAPIPPRRRAAISFGPN